MPTYRKQLQDKDGNVIIPAVSVQTSDIENGAVTADKIDFTTFEFATERQVGTLSGTPVYEKTITGTATLSGTDTVNITHGIANLSKCLSVSGYFDLTDGRSLMVPAIGANGNGVSAWTVNSTTVQIISNGMGAVVSGRIYYLTLRYTKSS